jgi:hypothetical protein
MNFGPRLTRKQQAAKAQSGGKCPYPDCGKDAAAGSFTCADHALAWQTLQKREAAKRQYAAKKLAKQEAA